MAFAYRVYYDSGTSNSRIYLLDADFNIRYTEKVNVGSKDSSIAGSNRVLIEALYGLYTRMLENTGVKESELDPVFYASGMVTSPYGLTEVPHLVIPTTVEHFAASLHRFHESQCFDRDFLLVPGLKSLGDDITAVNNMRGEEIEIIGTLDTLEERWPGRRIALILPGSHTHTVLIDRGGVQGILSQMTGELFFAMKSDTILAPILSTEDRTLDHDYVRLGLKNLADWGMNRAVYIGHAMRLFNEGTPAQRRSYCEGVLNGGFAQALVRMCQTAWAPCDTAVIVSNAYMYELYETLLAGTGVFREIGHLPISKEKSYAVDGLKKLLSLR